MNAKSPTPPGHRAFPAEESEDGAPGRETRQSGALLAAVAHRMSQPFTALRGTLELAHLKAKSVAEYRVAVEKALESADRLAWLLQELRELAEADVPWGEATLANLGELTDSVLEDLRPLAAARGVRIESRLAKNLEARTHSGHLCQALLKVIHHAILRSPEGKVVRVELSFAAEGVQWLVADEGAPLPLMGTALSFDALLAKTNLAGGSGESVLGLLTAARLISGLGGSVALQSSTEGKCRVLIRIPRHP